MRKLFYFLLFSTSFIYAQTTGITYQAVIYYPSGQNVPGVNIQNSPMANKPICLQFALLDNSSQIEYQETIQTTTDAYGMVNLVIGSGNQTGGYASSFNAVVWNTTTKSLKVELDANASCQQFTLLSNNPLSSVPFAYASVTANNVSGVVAIQNGGTGATNAIDAKINLGLGNVDNTSDANKPISTATQTALDTKENTANKSTTTTLGTSDVLFPTQNAVKTYVDTQVAAATIPDATSTVKGKIQLAGDLGGTAASPTVPGLATKENTITAGTTSQYFRGDKTWQTLDKTAVGLGNVDNTSDANKPISTATQTALDTKENTANKSTTTTLGTSDVLFPTQNAVKTYVDTQVAAATIADATSTLKGKIQLSGDLGGTAASPTVPGLATKENMITAGTTSQYFRGDKTWQTLDKTAVGLGNVDNTSDANKPISTATQTALDTKENTANKSTDVSTDGTSDVKFPSVKAVKDYVDTTITSNATPDATSTVKGKIQLAGDLTGTAASPAVATGAITTAKLAADAVTSAKITDGTIVVGDLADNAIETAKIKDANVTDAKLDKANIPLSGFAAAAADVALGSNKLTGVADPTAAQDAATKNYVDTTITSNATPDATTTVKGKLQLAGDLTGAAASPAVATGAITTAKLAADAVTTAKILDGTIVNADVANNAAIAFSKLNIAKSDIEGLGIPGSDTNTTYSAGTGVTLTGTTFSIGQDVATSATPTFAKVNKVTITEPSTNATLTIADGKTLTVSDDATVSGTNTGDQTIALTGDITGSGTGSFATTLANSGVTAGTYGSATAVPTLTVDAKGRITGAATTTISGVSPIGSSLTDGNIIIGNGSNEAAAVSVSGDVTMTNAGVTSIGTGQVTSSKILDGTIAVTDLADDAVETAKIKDANVTTAKLVDSAVTTVKLDNNAVTNLKIADASVTNAKLDKANIPLSGFGAATAAVALGSNKLTGVADPTSAQDAATKNYVDTAAAAITTLADGKIYIGNASNEATEVTLSGDVTTDNTGITSIGTGKVNSLKILDGTIAVTDLADNAVETVKIKDANITTAKLANDAVTTAKIADANVTYAKIQNVSATDKVLGRVSTGAGVIEEIATTGSGNVVRATSPTLVTPVIGVATGTSLSVSGQLTSTVATGTAPLVVTSTTPVANLNIGGNATNVTGTVAIANGGTGATTKAAAFDALSPMTTSGDIIYGGTSGTGTRLAKGTDGQVLTLASGAPSWELPAGVTSVGAISGSSTANGASITSGVLNLAPADGTNGGVVTTGSQTFAGAKTFTSVINVSPSATSSGDGASSVIKGQDATGSLKKGGSVSLTAGSSSSSANGGDVNITGGAGASNMGGGNILLKPGTGGSSGIVKVVGSDLFVNDDYFRVGKGGGNVSSNTAIGYQALNSVNTGGGNTGIGQLALYSNTSGTFNVSIGNSTMQDNTSGSYNTALGQSALYKNTIGTNNTALGNSSLNANTSGSYNVAIGNLALSSYNVSSSYNVAIGSSALRYSSAGNNTAIGNAAGVNMGYDGSAAVTGGANNIFLGYRAGASAGTSGLNYTGFNSVMIGYDVRPAANGESNEIVIAGYNGTAGTVGKGSNTTSIGNSATTDTYIYGNLNVTGQIKLNNAVLSKSATYAFQTTDNANLLVFTGSTAGQTITLPSAVTVGAGREITIKNIASVSVSIASAAGYLISDSTTTTATGLNIGIEPSNNWVKAISDGTNWIVLRALF